MVNNYSGETLLSQSGAILEFNFGRFKQEFTCPTEGDGNWWDIFTLDVENDMIVVTNKIMGNI